MQAMNAQSPEQDMDAALAAVMDTRAPMRVAMGALVLGLGGFLLWAGLAPLDEGVPTQGMVAIDTKRKAVQHQVGGIMKQVLVREGQFVKAGEPLVHLDDAVSVANFETARQHYLTLRATEARLLAEQLGQERIGHHPDVVKAAGDAWMRQVIDTQEQLFRSRRSALLAEQQAISESIRGQDASLQGYQEMLVARRNQLGFIEEDLKGMRSLVAEGYAPRNKQTELERMGAEARTSLADIEGNIQRLRSSMAELKLRAQQRAQEYRKEVDTQLAEVRREVQADGDKLRASGEELGRTVIRAPADGQVVGLVAQTVGGVVTPGQKLMDIVPEKEMLLLETKVPPHLVDRVRGGAPADVRFSSFSHSPQLVLEGQVESISGDLLAEPNQPPYYLARVAVTPAGMRVLGERVMQPGMPVEVIIRTGERSVLTYLLHPLLKRMAAAMKEE